MSRWVIAALATLMAAPAHGGSAPVEEPRVIAVTLQAHHRMSTLPSTECPEDPALAQAAGWDDSTLSFAPSHILLQSGEEIVLEVHAVANLSLHVTLHDPDGEMQSEGLASARRPARLALQPGLYTLSAPAGSAGVSTRIMVLE